VRGRWCRRGQDRLCLGLLGSEGEERKNSTLEHGVLVVTEGLEGLVVCHFLLLCFSKSNSKGNVPL